MSHRAAYGKLLLLGSLFMLITVHTVRLSAEAYPSPAQSSPVADAPAPTDTADQGIILLPAAADGAGARCAAGFHEVSLLIEPFETNFPLPNWTVTGVGRGGCIWTNTNPGNLANLTGGGGQFAMVNSQFCGNSPVDSELRTPALNLFSYTDPRVKFQYDYYQGDKNTDTGFLDFSIDGGATWSNIFTWNDDMRGPRAYESLNLSSAGGKTDFMVRWRYVANWDRWFQIDDVTVTACEAECFPLTLSHSGQGATPAAWPDRSFNCAAGEYNPNEQILLIAQPDPGWAVMNWNGTNNNSNGGNANWVTMLPQAHAASVFYRPASFILFLPANLN